MNDRYLYRAKRTDDEEWVEGYYFCMVHTDGRHTHHFIIPLGTSLEKGTLIEKIQVEVDPSTICQCTGVPDKNSKIAYEDDIIKTPIGKAKIVWNGSPSPTDYHIDDVGFKVFFLDATANDNYRHDLGYWIGKSKVIGNIFDNPDLLEVGE